MNTLLYSPHFLERGQRELVIIAKVKICLFMTAASDIINICIHIDRTTRQRMVSLMPPVVKASPGNFYLNQTIQSSNSNYADGMHSMQLARIIIETLRHPHHRR